MGSRTEAANQNRTRFGCGKRLDTREPGQKVCKTGPRRLHVVQWDLNCSHVPDRSPPAANSASGPRCPPSRLTSPTLFKVDFVHLHTASTDTAVHRCGVSRGAFKSYLRCRVEAFVSPHQGKLGCIRYSVGELERPATRKHPWALANLLSICIVWIYTPCCIAILFSGPRPSISFHSLCAPQ